LKLEFIDILGRRSKPWNSSTYLRHFVSRSETTQRMETSSRRSCQTKPSKDRSRTRSLLLSWTQSRLVLFLSERRVCLQQTHWISSRKFALNLHDFDSIQCRFSIGRIS